MQRAVSRRRSTVFNLTGSVLNTLVISIQGVVLIPIFMHGLGPKLFGAWLCGSEILLWMQVLDVGVQGLMIQRIGASHASGDRDALSEHFFTGVIVMGMLTVIGAAVGIMIAQLLPYWLQIPVDDARPLAQCLQLAILATAFIIASSAAATLARGVQQTGVMNIATLISTLTGFGTTLVFYWNGWGIWSLPIGISARAILALGINCLFVLLSLQRGMLRWVRPRTALLKEYLRLVPLSMVGGVGHSLMYQSEGATVGLVLGAEFAPVLLLTRKLAELVRSCVDMIGHCTFGSFSHLVASSERDRSLKIHAQLLAIWLTLALSGVATYIAVNKNLVTLWVGPDFFGGHRLTVLIGLQLLIAGSANLSNFLYRATGAVSESCQALFLESLIRLPLMVALIYGCGLCGVPLAAIATSLVAGAIIRRSTVRRLGSLSSSFRPKRAGMVAIYGLVLAIALITGPALTTSSWFVLVVVSALIAAATILLLLLADPLLADFRVQLQKIAATTLRRTQPLAAGHAETTN